MEKKKLLEISKTRNYAAAANACLEISPQTDYLKQFRARCLLSNEDFASLSNLLKKNSALPLEASYYSYRMRNYDLASSKIHGINLEKLTSIDKEILGLLKAQILQSQGKYALYQAELAKSLHFYESKQEEIDIWTNYLSTMDTQSMINSSRLTELKQQNSKNDIFELLFNELLLDSSNNKEYQGLINTIHDLKKSASFLDNLDDISDNSLSLLLQQSFIELKDKNKEKAQNICESILSHEANIPKWLKLLTAFNLYTANNDNLLSNKIIITLSTEIEDFVLKSTTTKNFMHSFPYKLCQDILLNYCIWLLNGFKLGPCLTLVNRLLEKFPEKQDDLILIKVTVNLFKNKTQSARSIVTEYVKDISRLRKNELLSGYLFNLLQMKNINRSEVESVLNELNDFIYENYVTLFFSASPNKIDFLEKSFQFNLEKKNEENLEEITNLLLKEYKKSGLHSKVIETCEKLESFPKLKSQFENEETTSQAFINPNVVEERILKLASDASSNIDIDTIFQDGIPNLTQSEAETKEEIAKKVKARRKLKAKAHRKKLHLAKLVEKGIDPTDGERNLDPERWIPFHFRKANLRRRKKDKKSTGGGQGGVDEKVAAKLDVKTNLDKKKSTKSKYGNKKRRGRR